MKCQPSQDWISFPVPRTVKVGLYGFRLFIQFINNIPVYNHFYISDSLQEELVAVLPSIEEANEISAEMSKPVKFEIVLVAPEIQNSPVEKMVPSQVCVPIKNILMTQRYLLFFTGVRQDEKFGTRN